MADIIFVRQKEFDFFRGKGFCIKDNIGVERIIIPNSNFVIMVDETQPEEEQEEEQEEETPQPDVTPTE